MSTTPYNLPDEITEQLFDYLDSIGYLSERLHKHAAGCADADSPDELTQRDLLGHIDGISCIAKEVSRIIRERIQRRRMETPV